MGGRGQGGGKEIGLDGRAVCVVTFGGGGGDGGSVVVVWWW